MKLINKSNNEKLIAVESVFISNQSINAYKIESLSIGTYHNFESINFIFQVNNIDYNIIFVSHNQSPNENNLKTIEGEINHFMKDIKIPLIPHF